MDQDLKERKSEWRYQPIVILTGILLIYSISNSISALFNF